jgi:hypothetical protein
MKVVTQGSHRISKDAAQREKGGGKAGQTQTLRLSIQSRDIAGQIAEWDKMGYLSIFARGSKSTEAAVFVALLGCLIFSSSFSAH